MVSQKLLALTTLLFIIKVNRVHAQCQVEYINQPYTTSPTMMTTASYVQPVSPFVIPAVLQPVHTDPYMGVIPPSIPDYTKLYNPALPVGGMPPIIFDNSNDNDGLDNLLYFLLFALMNKKNNIFKRNCNNGGCSCGNTYSGNSCNCNNCNNCGAMPCGCSNNSGCSICNCGNCGNRGGCEKCSICGKCGSSGNYGGGNNGSNGCGSVSQSINGYPCGSNCIFIPFPIAVPIGNAFQCNNGSGCPIHSIESFGCYEECPSNNGQSPNEINLIIRADC